ERGPRARVPTRDSPSSLAPDVDEEIAQPALPVEEARLDGPDARSGHPRDLLERQVGDEPKRAHLALTPRKRRERGDHPALHLVHRAHAGGGLVHGTPPTRP